MAVSPVLFAGLMPMQPLATNNEPETAKIEVVDPTSEISMKFTSGVEAVNTPENVEELIRQKAHSNNLEEEKLIYIAKCESRIEPQAIGDGHLICAKTGKPMRSRGIWQINDCGHPDISDEQAFDPVWSTDWAAEVFKKGGESKEWKICSVRYDKSIK